MVTSTGVTDTLVGASKAIAAFVGAALAVLVKLNTFSAFIPEGIETYVALAITVLTGVAAYFAPYAPTSKSGKVRRK